MRLANWIDTAVASCCTCILGISYEAISYAACELKKQPSHLAVHASCVSAIKPWVMLRVNGREIAVASCRTCTSCISNQAMSCAACESNRDSYCILWYTHLVYQRWSYELWGMRIEEIAIASCCTRIFCISNQAMSYGQQRSSIAAASRPQRIENWCTKSEHW